jgi:hypothetical protein
MSTVDQATETQIKNIQAKNGKTLPELTALIQNSGLTKHGEIRKMLMDTLGMTYGDANTLTHVVLKSDGERRAEAQGLSTADVLADIYTGPKAALRPIHDRLMQAIQGFGEFEIAPKKGYVSLRRKKQFAMIGPATRDQVEVGLNVKDLPVDERLKAQPSGAMCNYTTRLKDAAQVDDTLIDWLRQAYDRAG